jgi:hypothetical protein
MRVALLSFTLIACASAPPLPGGPPPEYEPSPIYSSASAATAAPPASSGASTPNSVISAAPAIVDAGVVLPVLDRDGGA